MKWILAETESASVTALAAELGVSMPVARVLCARGLNSVEGARRFLAPSFNDLHDPFLMIGMQEAVLRIIRAIEHKESTCSMAITTSMAPAHWWC